MLESTTIAQLYHDAGRVYAYKRSSGDESGLRPGYGTQQLDPPSSPDLAIADVKRRFGRPGLGDAPEIYPRSGGAHGCRQNDRDLSAQRIRFG